MKPILIISFLLTLSACSLFNSSDSDEVRITIQGQSFGVGDSISVSIANHYGHDLYLHLQSRWSLQQKVENEWKTIYSPVVDTGPARFSVYVKSGDRRIATYPSLPSSSYFDEAGENAFRYVFGFYHKPDLNKPIPENQRMKPVFRIHDSP